MPPAVCGVAAFLGAGGGRHGVIHLPVFAAVTALPGFISLRRRGFPRAYGAERGCHCVGGNDYLCADVHELAQFQEVFVVEANAPQGGARAYGFGAVGAVDAYMLPLSAQAHEPGAVVASRGVPLPAAGVLYGTDGESAVRGAVIAAALFLSVIDAECYRKTCYRIVFLFHDIEPEGRFVDYDGAVRGLHGIGRHRLQHHQ